MDIIMTVTLKDDTETIGFKRTSGKTVQLNQEQVSPDFSRGEV